MEYLNNLLNSNTQSGGVYGVSMHQLNQILQLSSAYFNRFDDNTKQQYIKLFGFTPLSLLKGHSSSKMPQYREKFIFLIYLQFCVLLMMNKTAGMSEQEVLKYLSKLCVKFNVDSNNSICSKIKDAFSITVKAPDQKEINLQNLYSCNNNILIVMIGNMPTDETSVEHWKKFIQTSDETLHIVIHPLKIDISNDIRTKWMNLFKNKNNFMICDQDHWVKTKWGNISLSLATLLAIDYAMKNKPFGFYKKIVFLQQCLPLYNYSVIKKEFLIDNKSWFKPRNGEYPGWQYSQPYNFNREENNGATIYDWNWWNAIFALDCSHLNILFDDKQIDAKGNYIGTYKKEGKYTCYGEEFDNIIPINKGKYDVLFKQVTGSWDWNNPSMTASCINSDEVFFGLAFKQHFKGNDIINHTRLINLDALEKLYTKNILSDIKITNPNKIVYLFDDEDKKKILDFKSNFGENNEYPKLDLKDKKITTLDNNLYIYLPRITWLFFELFKKDKNYPLYTGIASNYNPEKLQEYYVKRVEKVDGELKNTYLKDGKKVNIDYDKEWSEKGIQELKIKNPDTNDKNQFTAKNIYDQSLTYNDWTSFTISPENIFRDASFTKYVNNKCNNTGKISDKFDENILSLINNIEKENLRLIPNKLPIWHPSEYFTINLKKIINAYNIMSLCIVCKDNLIDINSNILTGGKYGDVENIGYGYTQEETHNYFNLIKIIKFVWRRAILLFSDYVDEKQNESGNSYFIFKSELSFDKLKILENIKLGTCISEDILSSALANGSLFIRKCVKGSEMNIYTDALFNIKNYVPNDTDKFSKYSNKKDFGEFLYLPESIFTWEFYRKSRKSICNDLNTFDINNIDINTKINFKQNENITINDKLFKYNKVLAKGTNNVVLYTSDDNKNILIKQAIKSGSLNDDIKAYDLLKEKKYEDKFIFNHIIDQNNIILELLDNPINTFVADYIYKNLLTVSEYLKIIYFVIDVFYEMSKDNLYYVDLKIDNMLYKCEGKETYKIKFGDIGSLQKYDIKDNIKSLSFYPIKNTKDKGEKQIIWSVGTFILQLISGVYIDQRLYQQTWKKKSSAEFETYFENIKNPSLKNIDGYFKNEKLIDFINKLFGYGDNDIYTIEKMHSEFNNILTFETEKKGGSYNNIDITNTLQDIF